MTDTTAPTGAKDIARGVAAAAALAQESSSTLWRAFDVLYEAVRPHVVLETVPDTDRKIIVSTPALDAYNESVGRPTRKGDNPVIGVVGAAFVSEPKRSTKSNYARFFAACLEYHDAAPSAVVEKYGGYAAAIKVWEATGGGYKRSRLAKERADATGDDGESAGDDHDPDAERELRERVDTLARQHDAIERELWTLQASLRDLMREHPELAVYPTLAVYLSEPPPKSAEPQAPTPPKTHDDAPEEPTTTLAELRERIERQPQAPAPSSDIELPSDYDRQVTDVWARFELAPILREIIHGIGRSPSKIAAELNEQCVDTRSGGRWTAANVSNYLRRLRDLGVSLEPE